jgi:hypothetical protein
MKFGIDIGHKAKTRLQELGITSEKLDEILGLVKVNARITPDFLWLSIQL